MANNKQKMLGLNDLGTVLTEIHSVRAKWYNIGLQLSVPVADLQRIESECDKNDHDTCLRRMLIKWLETGCATWKTLIDALQSTIVQGPGENKALAEVLRQKYCGEVGEEEGKNKGKKRKTTQTTIAGSNSSGGASAAASTSEKSSTNSNPTRDHQSTDGTSKSREKPSAVPGEAPGASQAKKSLPTSDSPGPSAAKTSKLASTKLPDSFARDDFLRQPKDDRLCVKCDHVPYNPQRSVCCNRLYCEPCSKRMKRCRTHKEDLQYTFDKELYSKIQKLNIKCPNRGGGCEWTGIVLHLKNHLPACGPPSGSSTIPIMPLPVEGKRTPFLSDVNAGVAAIQLDEEETDSEDMKLAEYLSKLRKRGICGFVTIKESLEACRGGELKQEYVDEVMKKITIDDSEATAIPRSPKSADPCELVVREKKVNNSDEATTMTYTANATWNNTSLKWKETTSGWSVTAGAGAEKYAKGHGSFEYHRGKTESDIKTASFEARKAFKHSFVMEPHSSSEVTVVKVETEYTADIKKLRVKFPHDTKLKVRSVVGPAGEMLLSKVLEKKGSYIVKRDKDDNTIIEVDAKFKAMHVATEVKVYPVPS